METAPSEIIAKFLRVYTVSALRYILFAGVLYLVFYVWKRRDWIYLKIQTKFPAARDIQREIAYSALSIAVFASVATAIFLLRKNGYTKIYTDIAQFGWLYFAFTVIAFILLHDTYFYWMHRLMHWKKIYPYVHRIHHVSTNPTPWAAFAFHPLEALIEVGILPIVIFLLPVHRYAIIIWVLYQSGMNVLGHLGFEMFAPGFASGKLSKWHNTSTHHNMHHRLVNCNYGLYFNFWDRVMGTNHTHYEREFENVVNTARHNITTGEPLSE